MRTAASGLTEFESPVSFVWVQHRYIIIRVVPKSTNRLFRCQTQRSVSRLYVRLQLRVRPILFCIFNTRIIYWTRTNNDTIRLLLKRSMGKKKNRKKFDRLSCTAYIGREINREAFIAIWKKKKTVKLDSREAKRKCPMKI